MNGGIGTSKDRHKPGVWSWKQELRGQYVRQNADHHHAASPITWIRVSSKLSLIPILSTAVFYFLNLCWSQYFRRWELLNPDAVNSYLPHPRPVDGAAMTFRKISTTD
jgi:hypothetical protein